MAVAKPEGEKKAGAKLTDHLDKNKGDSGASRLFNFTLTHAQYEDLKNYAAARGVAASAIVKLALYEYMATHAKEWETNR